MSSHHFVREGQEPSLFILQSLSFEIIQPLLEWVPTIIVADQVVEVALQWGIKIDVVLQRTVPSRDLGEMLANQTPVTILTCETDDVATEGLHFLIEKYHSTAVNILAEWDSALLKALEKFIHPLQLVVFSKTQKWSAIADVFEKWLPAGSRIFINAPHFSDLQVQNLIQIGEEWETIESGLVRAQAKGPFWIGEWN